MPGLQLLYSYNFYRVIVSKLLRENQQGGGKFTAPPPPRLGLKHWFSVNFTVIINHISPKSVIEIPAVRLKI